MGNSNSDIDQSQLPTAPVLHQPVFQGKTLINSKHIIQLKVLLKDAIEQFKKDGQNLKEFEKQLKNISITRGQNFQGKVNEEGDIVGLGKYYDQNGEQCSVYFGQCHNGQAINRGINLTCNLKQSPDGQKVINKQFYQAYLIQDWTPNSQNLFRGCMIKKEGSKSLHYKGQFKDKEFKVGKLILKRLEITKFIYQGEFDCNNMHGNGKLIIPGKYEYNGNFKNQYKHGIGRQFDHTRHTEYIGQFENGNRNGYGQLTYKNRQNVKLKGFWNDGYMDSGDGVYVSAEGVYLQTIGDDIQLM